jgi:hypothetical protein
MRSRITIELDFDKGQPFIKVLNNTVSDDVRDKLVTFFRQRLGHTSSWGKIIFPTYPNVDSDEVLFEIHPLRPDQLEDESKIMAGQVKMNSTFPEQASITH